MTKNKDNEPKKKKRKYTVSKKVIEANAKKGLLSKGKTSELKKRTSKENGKKGGTKKYEANFKKIEKEINMNEVVYWIGLQATAEEIAGSFRVSPDTLDRRLKEEFGLGFAELKSKLGGGADGKLRLRRNQFRMSENNATMAIWLGKQKQWLDQKDTLHQETNINSQNKVTVYIPENGRD